MANEDKPNGRRRGRKPKNTPTSGDGIDNLQPGSKPAGRKQPKLGYKVLIAPLSSDLQAAAVIGPEGCRHISLRTSGAEWSEVPADGGFWLLLEKLFKSRKSGARLVSQYVHYEDVSLPHNHRLPTEPKTPYDDLTETEAERQHEADLQDS